MKNDLCRSNVCFSLRGDVFDPEEISEILAIKSTKQWKKGDSGKYNPKLKYSLWQISTEVGIEYIWIDKLIRKIIRKLKNKTAEINRLKKKYKLISVLEVVLYVDINDKETTPALNLDNKAIEFLHKTGTKFDVDIYRFDSNKMDINTGKID